MRDIRQRRLMKEKEAKARIKINRLLEEAGWFFFNDNGQKANIQLEKNVKINETDLARLGDDFENSRNGFVDYLLLDANGYPIIVLEAKSEDKDPLDGKEQARRYAQTLGVRFIILSNGSIHYFWDLTKGNPNIITKFPSPNSITQLNRLKPNPDRLVSEDVTIEYILHSQNPLFESDPEWIDTTKRVSYLSANNYSLLRDYQLRAVQSIQKSVADGNDRFLFEMATGTGKTLISAAVIRLFLRTGNVTRVLFLVDRLELESQAKKAFTEYLKFDYPIVIYKENRDDWDKARIVISTVQSLADKYRQLFSPTDFDLVISDEAHRSINGNARAIFEFFGGYKLGLTATPKDYLKNLDINAIRELDPRIYEKRLLLDTYKTFGCDGSEPTFRYTLLDGVREGFLLNPIVVDARTSVTTKLLSDVGFSVLVPDNDGNLQEELYRQNDFERSFFSDSTNRVLCETFLNHGLRDPICGEFGKSIVYCVSQNHASKITSLLNEIMQERYPDKYSSDFAVQVTSRIPNSQQMTINFQNNNLNGYTRFFDGYRSSRTRVCVTVGMMTTGYDCTDLLNIALMRPIFSPSEFIQIKGRGTRKHSFKYTLHQGNTTDVLIKEKQAFKLFDFFANCEYFDTKFNYDEVLELPKSSSTSEKIPLTLPPVSDDVFSYKKTDYISLLQQNSVGQEGMRVDRMMFDRFAEQVKENQFVVEKIKDDDYSAAEDYIIENIFDKPDDFFNLEKLRKTLQTDWRVPFKQILEYIFGHINKIKGKQEVLDEEFDKFLVIQHPDSRYVPIAKRFFKAYVTDEQIRMIINNKEYAKLATNSKLTIQDLKALNGLRDTIPKYVKDYVPLNFFM